MDYGILGSSDLDQASPLAAKLQTDFLLPLRHYHGITILLDLDTQNVLWSKNATAHLCIKII